MESQPKMTTWYFDNQNFPICQSIMYSEQTCNYAERCAFSHNQPFRSCYVMINNIKNPHELAQDLKRQALESNQPLMSLEDPDSYFDVNEPELPDYLEDMGFQDDHENDVEKDIEQIDRLMKEMKNFEEGPENEEKQMMCPFLIDTGNCLIRSICPFIHSEDDPLKESIAKFQEWYPDSMNCECCKGYVHACQGEACVKSEKCVLCPADG